MKRVLIAYATKTNTTKEYAEYIKGKLESEIVSVDMLKVSEVKSLESYDAVIVGASINGMMWLPEASNFVYENVDALTKLPTFYFFVSYIYENGRKIWQKAIKNSINKVIKIVEPISYSVFGGRVDKKFTRFFAWVFGIKKDLSINLINFKKVDELIKEIKKVL